MKRRILRYLYLGMSVSISQPVLAVSAGDWLKLMRQSLVSCPSRKKFHCERSRKLVSYEQWPVLSARM